MKQSGRVRRKVGDVVVIPLSNRASGFGRVLDEPEIAFYHLKDDKIPPIEEILASPIAFVIPVMNYAITRDLWRVIANVPLEPALRREPLYFKKDDISGELYIYHLGTGEEIRATRRQCKNLECAAVWDPNHVIDRLEDMFSVRPNKWVEDLRP